MDSEFEDIFMELHAKHRLSQTVHQAADKIIIKRQRTEFEEEERSLDERSQSSKGISWSSIPLRVKLLRTGLGSKCDGNTYTSFWIVPDFVALQTGIPGLILTGFANENHFNPAPTAFYREITY
ncbi:hypothetical protein BGX34_007107 [Mortierella sp. NVP85]|nr:hypothetical protein BGX34_007107 [Mortierella sp. NVP85]